VKGAHILGTAALLVATPLSAQEVPLRAGDQVQFQKVGATTWVGGTISAVGSCLTVRFDDEPETADGFTTHSFGAVSGVRIRGEKEGWKVASADQLGRLRNCLSGGHTAAVPAKECGASPSAALGAMQGRLYGLQMGGGDPAWDNIAGLPKEAVEIVTEKTLCERIVAAAAAPGEILPLLGVLRLGDLGFALQRGILPTTPGGSMSLSTTLLAPDLRVLDRK